MKSIFLCGITLVLEINQKLITIINLETKNPMEQIIRIF